ncbi:hypothetical protein ACF0H5_010466 [Mactra antiquata]
MAVKIDEKVIMSRFAHIYDWNMNEEDRRRLAEIRKMIDIKEFDIWSLIRRAETTDSYVLEAKFRMGLTAAQRNKYSKKIVRRRKRPLPSRKTKVDPNTGELVPIDEEETPAEEEYDFDADEDITAKQNKGDHCQELYMKACKKFKVHPIAFFYKALNWEGCRLRHRQLTANEIKTICIGLLGNSTIEVLDLRDNDMGEKGAQYIAELLQENIFIHSLNLSDNHLGINGVRHIVDVVVEQDIMKKLDLSGIVYTKCNVHCVVRSNGIRENDAEVLRPLFEKTTNLTHLKLSHNEIRESGAEVIAEALMDNETIISLDLSWNHLRRDGGCWIADAIAENTHLQILNLAWNGLYLDGCREIANALKENRTLIELDLTCNRINKECLEKLLGGLKYNDTLESLHIGYNPLTPEGAMIMLEFLRDTPTCGIWRLDLTDQKVEPAFAELLNELQRSRFNLQVIHGLVLGRDKIVDDDEEKALMDENPIIVLMEFGKLMGFRLMDLFASLDKDGSKTLSHDEIRTGLRMVNIPLSDKCIEILIDKLDVDGDGEVDFGELIAAQAEHRKKMSKFYAAKEMKIDMSETEIGRVRLKLSRLMAKEMQGNPAFRRQSKLLLGQLGLVPDLAARRESKIELDPKDLAMLQQQHSQQSAT